MTPPTTASAAKQPHPIATVLFINSIRNGRSQYHYYPKSGGQVSCPRKLVQKSGGHTRRKKCIGVWGYRRIGVGCPRGYDESGRCVPFLMSPICPIGPICGSD